jgi:hypothetical protein
MVATGNITIDALVYSSQSPAPGWPAMLTYSFPTALPITADADDAKGFAPMTLAQQAAVKVALDSWAAVANLRFFKVTSGGDIQVGTNDQGDQSSAYAYLPGGRGPTYMFTNNQSAGSTTYGEGDFGRSVLIHEFGHTLGLKHPGDYNAGGGSVDGPFLPKLLDNLDYTQMSYNEGAGFELNGNYGITPMLYDIQAIQYLYGANTSYHIDNDTYSFVRDSALQCIWDAGGTDTLDFSQCTGATIIDLNQGGFSSTAPGYNNISIAYNVKIERAIAGSGGSTIYGNDSGNVITGGWGNDVIHLGAGSDVVSGGGGADTVVFDLGLSHYLLEVTKTGLIVSGEGDDVLSNISALQFGARTIQLSSYAAVIGGNASDNAFAARDGSELFSGGDGTDSVSYGSARANFSVQADGDAFTVSDRGGSGGVDLLSGVERLLFADGSGVALDIGGFAGQTYRLYQAAFNRAPDLPGMGFWLKHLDNGMGLTAMSQNFLQSKEGVAAYGALNDAQFVTKLYANVLHRAPDAAGFDFHLGHLTSGAYSRAQVLTGFSESPENTAALVGVISNGIEFTIV